MKYESGALLVEINEAGTMTIAKLAKAEPVSARPYEIRQVTLHPKETKELMAWIVANNYKISEKIMLTELKLTPEQRHAWNGLGSEWQ